VGLTVRSGLASRHSWSMVGIAIIAFAMVSPSIPTPLARSATGVAFGPASTHIQHIITIVMENRDYDEYFGEYCLTLGAYCADTGNGIPSSACIPYNPANVSLGCVKPYNFTARQYVYSDIPHNWASGRTALDGGAMDGFYSAEAGATQAFGHYNASTIPIYYDLAEEYAMSDNAFAGNLSYSLPNHWTIVSGSIPATPFDSYVSSGSSRTSYLDEANSTPTVENLLNGTNVSWKYYDYALAPWSKAVNNTGVVTDGSAINYWNPMAAQPQSYTSSYNSHFVPRTQFLTDAAAGLLPNISWLIPSWSESDHPGTNITAGMTFVAQAINAVEVSPDWNSTAIFLIWDDYGGFYDQVAPPTISGDLLSFRSPMILISPFARENYVDHHFLDFFSLLHFSEWQFGLGCLTTLDCNATLPFGLFNFNQTARSPIIFPTNPLAATYPMPLQKRSFGQVWGYLYVPTDPLAWNANSTLPPGVTIIDEA
jgi:phospholipase C